MKRIVLCRPAGPRNVGAILRAALNFGPAEIVITSPARPSLLVHPDFELMSHGGEDARGRAMRPPVRVRPVRRADEELPVLPHGRLGVDGHHRRARRLID